MSITFSNMSVSQSKVIYMMWMCFPTLKPSLIQTLITICLPKKKPPIEKRKEEKSSKSPSLLHFKLWTKCEAWIQDSKASAPTTELVGPKNSALGCHSDFRYTVCEPLKYFSLVLLNFVQLINIHVYIYNIYILRPSIHDRWQAQCETCLEYPAQVWKPFTRWT